MLVNGSFFLGAFVWRRLLPLCLRSRIAGGGFRGRLRIVPLAPRFGPFYGPATLSQFLGCPSGAPSNHEVGFGGWGECWGSW
jgi:hypothetical protein